MMMPFLPWESCLRFLLLADCELWILPGVWIFNTVYLMCREVDVSSNRKAVIVHVPYRLRKAFQKIHARLVRELEKKFSGKVSSSSQLPL